MVIRAVYARSRFAEGIRILEHAGFQEMADISPVNGKQVYCLSMDQVNGPFAMVYKQAFAEHASRD